MTAGYFAETGPVVHIAPSPLFHLGPLVITNSILYGWISMVILVVFLTWVARKVRVHPIAGPVQLVEMAAEFIMSMVTSGFDDKREARRHMPFFVTLFFFLILNNWLGLVPGVGEALTVRGVPLLRPFTADFNATLAAAAVTMIYVYTASIRSFGGFGRYIGHFFVGSPLNPIYLIIGLLEMITDLLRVFSLSLRLFLNVAIGEIIIGVFAYLGHQIAPLTATPFTLIELFVGALQAYIFVTLSTMYLSAAVNHAGHSHPPTPEPTSDELAAHELAAQGSHA